jgi:putative ATPase
MRPQDLSEFVGQEHILGPGKLLRRAIEADRLMSLILYGPPGVGKTALAHLIAERSRAHFVPLNAVTAGVADIRKVAQESALERTSGGNSRLAPLSFRGLWTRLWVAIIASTPGPSCSPDIGTRRRFRGQAGS